MAILCNPFRGLPVEAVLPVVESMDGTILIRNVESQEVELEVGPIKTDQHSESCIFTVR
jgi:hypothetical protein